MSIKPAMSPEKWELLRKLHIQWGEQTLRWADGEVDPTGMTPHETAALCLVGQPFGFTREDVERLETWTRLTDGPTQLFDLADRIEALLPPED